jgi:hypothetical protein
MKEIVDLKKEMKIIKVVHSNVTSPIPSQRHVMMSSCWVNTITTNGS